MNTEARVVKVLLKAGVAPGSKGYDYLKTAITFALEDHTLLYRVSKGLYTKVGNIYGTAPITVSRTAANIINSAVLNIPPDTFYELFGNVADQRSNPPSTSVFIGCLTEYIKTCMREDEDDC